MRAIISTSPDAAGLVLDDIAAPSPGPGEILIKVAAAGVNRPDVLQRRGLYPPPAGASDRLGLEVAGRVDALGPGVSSWRPGQAVCALVNGGGYAECVVARADQVLPVPANFSYLQAAALPESFFTVWHNVFQRGGLGRGELLLVHGGASGIGTTAVQLASACGARVFATTRSAAKCPAIEALGAERAIDVMSEDYVEILRGAGGADVILDMVGGDYIARNFRAAAADARIVNIAYLAGSKITLDLLPVMLKRLTLTGSTLRSQTDEVKAAIAQQLHAQVWPMLSRGELAPVIAAHFPLAEAARAHQFMESDEHIGKIVLAVEDMA